MLTARGLKVIKTMLIKTLDITVRCGMEVNFAYKIGCTATSLGGSQK